MHFPRPRGRRFPRPTWRRPAGPAAPRQGHLWSRSWAQFRVTPDRSSLRLDAAQLDDGFVARRFGPEESGGRGWSESYGNMTQLADTLAYARIGQRRAELGGEALDDARIRAVRRREHPPVAAHPLRKSGFDGRRDTGQLGHAPARHHGEHLEPAGLYGPDDSRERGEGDLDVVGEQRLDHRGRALVRHVHERIAGFLRNRRAGEVSRRAGTRRAVIELARIG